MPDPLVELEIRGKGTERDAAAVDDFVDGDRILLRPGRGGGTAESSRGIEAHGYVVRIILDCHPYLAAAEGFLP